MPRPFGSLQFHGEDRCLRDVEGLSRHARINRAFVRVCVTLGCPTVEDRLSLEMLLDWLFVHYPEVRAATGLPEMVPVTDVPPGVETRLMMGNAMITLLEHSHSRASDLLSKRHLSMMLGIVERSLDI